MQGRTMGLVGVALGLLATAACADGGGAGAERTSSADALFLVDEIEPEQRFDLRVAVDGGVIAQLSPVVEMDVEVGTVDAGAEATVRLVDADGSLVTPLTLEGTGVAAQATWRDPLPCDEGPCERTVEIVVEHAGTGTIDGRVFVTLIVQDALQVSPSIRLEAQGG